MTKYQVLAVEKPGRETVQPWLDLANLLPFDSEPPRPDEVEGSFVEDFFEAAGPRASEGVIRITKLPAADVFRWTDWTDRAEAARAFYHLFFNVRRVMTDFVQREGTNPTKAAPPTAHASTPDLSRVPVPPLLGSVSIYMNTSRTGRIWFSNDPALELFQHCFEGVEVQRIRTCPECGRFYYATRSDKGACDDHLTLMRVRRARNQRGRYEKARQYRKRLRVKAVKGNERKRLLNLHASLTSIQRGQPTQEEDKK